MIVIVDALGALSVTQCETEQELPSVTVTQCTPPANPVAVAFVCAPASHKNVYGDPAPPIADTVASPSVNPKQLGSLVAVVLTVMPEGSLSVTQCRAVQVLASTAVTQ